jgi:uncharacterized membrane protein YkgB
VKTDLKWLETYQEKHKEDHPNTPIYALGFLILIISIAIVLGSYAAGVGSPLISTTFTASSATVSIFAIVYILAQFDERLVDPFSNTGWFGYNPKDSTDQSQLTTDPKQAARKQARVISLWCFASGIGIVLCYFTVGLLQVISIPAASASNLGHLGDSILSGIVIGGGTKPLHDLINLFDNSSNPKSTGN